MLPTYHGCKVSKNLIPWNETHLSSVSWGQCNTGLHWAKTKVSTKLHCLWRLVGVLRIRGLFKGKTVPMRGSIRQGTATGEHKEIPCSMRCSGGWQQGLTKKKGSRQGGFWGQGGQRSPYLSRWCHSAEWLSESSQGQLRHGGLNPWALVHHGPAGTGVVRGRPSRQALGDKKKKKKTACLDHLKKYSMWKIRI